MVLNHQLPLENCYGGIKTYWSTPKLFIDFLAILIMCRSIAETILSGIARRSWIRLLTTYSSISDSSKSEYKATTYL